MQSICCAVPSKRSVPCGIAQCIQHLPDGNRIGFCIGSLCHVGVALPAGQWIKKEKRAARNGISPHRCAGLMHVYLTCNVLHFQQQNKYRNFILRIVSIYCCLLYFFFFLSLLSLCFAPLFSHIFFSSLLWIGTTECDIVPRHDNPFAYFFGVSVTQTITHTWTEGVGVLSSWPSDVVIVLYAWCRRQTQPDAAPRHTHIEINRATAFNAIYSTEEKHDNYPKNSFQCTSSAQYMHTHMLSHCSSVAMSVQQQQQR